MTDTPHSVRVAGRGCLLVDVAAGGAGTSLWGSFSPSRPGVARRLPDAPLSIMPHPLGATECGARGTPKPLDLLRQTMGPRFFHVLNRDLKSGSTVALALVQKENNKLAISFRSYKGLGHTSCNFFAVLYRLIERKQTLCFRNGPCLTAGSKSRAASGTMRTC